VFRLLKKDKFPKRILRKKAAEALKSKGNRGLAFENFVLGHPL
jgi:hypothetical protein